VRVGVGRERREGSERKEGKERKEGRVTQEASEAGKEVKWVVGVSPQQQPVCAVCDQPNHHRVSSRVVRCPACRALALRPTHQRGCNPREERG